MQELRNNPSTPDWKKIRAELQRLAKVVRAQFQRLRRQLDSQGTSQTATYLAGFTVANGFVCLPSFNLEHI